jgi:hypothetical protein
MKWPSRTAAAALITIGLAWPSSAGQVKLEIHDGLVTLDAKDATIREIFAEWARVGQTRVLNAERVPSAPLTLQLNAVPEAMALETLLRSAAGFIAAPRVMAQATGSRYDRIVLMPGTRPSTVAGGPGAQPASAYNQRIQIQPQPVVTADDDDESVISAPPAMSPYGASSAQPGVAPAQPPANVTGVQGNPNNPYGVVYPNPNNPAQAAPNGQPPNAAPPPALRPGVPVGPIKQPGGPGGAGQ